MKLEFFFPSVCSDKLIWQIRIVNEFISIFLFFPLVFWTYELAYFFPFLVLCTSGDWLTCIIPCESCVFSPQVIPDGGLCGGGIIQC